MRYVQPFTNTIHLLTRCITSLKGWAHTQGWSYGCFLKLHQVRDLGLQTLGNKPWCCISYKKEKNGQGQRKSKVELLQLIRAQAHEPAKCPTDKLYTAKKSWTAATRGMGTERRLEINEDVTLKIFPALALVSHAIDDIQTTENLSSYPNSFTYLCSF